MVMMTAGGTQVPVKVVGSSIFGKHPIISDERTWNMFISDNWLLNFAGYTEAVHLEDGVVEGRGLFHSVRGNFLLAVVGSQVFRIEPNLGFVTLLFTLGSSSGEVFMDENLFSQIAIVDGISHGYIYNYTTTAVPAIGPIDWDNAGTGAPSADITPNYVTYHNNNFLFGNAVTDNSGSRWYIYKSGYTAPATDPLKLSWVQTLVLQTKPDFAKAVVRIPSFGNNVLVLGTTVGEIWTSVAGIQAYQRQSSVNIDYGVASVSTIAASEDFVAWLGINEKSEPAIMVMSGGQSKRISTDGIDNLLSRINRPDQSTAMFYRQDGHVFYILTFFDPSDNITLTYDFTMDKFYDLTDWDFSYFPAREVVFFNNEIYFLSIKQPSIMHFSTEITTMTPSFGNTYEIPRIRKCDTYRMPGSERFIVNRFSFTIENGVEQGVFFDFECDGFLIGEVSGGIIYTEDDIPILSEEGSCQVYRPRIDVTLSKNGGETYGNAVPYYMHATGHYKNQPIFNSLGQANQFTVQMRFHGLGRFTVNDGFLEVYQ